MRTHPIHRAPLRTRTVVGVPPRSPALRAIASIVLDDDVLDDDVLDDDARRRVTTTRRRAPHSPRAD